MAQRKFKFPWINPTPNVWKLYLHHFIAEVRPTYGDRYLSESWAGGPERPVNVTDMKSKTATAAKKIVENRYKKLMKVKSWLLDLPTGPHLAEGGKKRHGREPEWYESQGKWVLELGKKGFAHVMPNERLGGWRARVYDAEGNLIHEGIPQGGLKHAKEWARMFLDVPAGKFLTSAIHARHAQRWSGGKLGHGAPGIGKLTADVNKLLK